MNIMKNTGHSEHWRIENVSGPSADAPGSSSRLAGFVDEVWPHEDAFSDAGLEVIPWIGKFPNENKS